MGSNIWKTIEINGHFLKNRLVVPPMMTGTATGGGMPTDRGLQAYRNFAGSGAGLVILEYHSPRIDGFLHSNQYGLHDDSSIERSRFAGTNQPLGQCSRHEQMP